MRLNELKKVVVITWKGRKTIREFQGWKDLIKTLANFCQEHDITRDSVWDLGLEVSDMSGLPRWNERTGGSRDMLLLLHYGKEAVREAMLWTAAGI